MLGYLNHILTIDLERKRVPHDNLPLKKAKNSNEK